MGAHRDPTFSTTTEDFSLLLWTRLPAFYKPTSSFLMAFFLVTGKGVDICVMQLQNDTETMFLTNSKSCQDITLYPMNKSLSSIVI